MNIVEKICTRSDCYNANRQITVEGLMLHSVGCNQPDPEVFFRTWNKPDCNVCAHAVAGADGKVIQTLPWTWRGWHGGGSSNNNYIGVEMTEPDTIRYTGGANWVEKADGSNTKRHVDGMYKTAVELFAFLCEKFNLDPLKKGVIVSHSEGHKLGIASGHADVEHLWSHFGYSMDGFRKAVSAKLEEMRSNSTTVENPVEGVDKPAEGSKKGLHYVRLVWSDAKSQIGAFENIEYAKRLVDEKPEYTVFSENGSVEYQAAGVSDNKTNDSNVGEVGKFIELKAGTKVYKESTGFEVALTIDKDGVFTSVAEANGRYKLKSGAGWVSIVPEKDFDPYVVKVTANALNIRKEPNVQAERTGIIEDRGCYTIIEENNGWGMLKSGAGWICLAYTRRV